MGKMNLTVFNFTGVYELESFYRQDKGSYLCDLSADIVDMKGISGTNCFCDDQARDEIRNIITEKGISSKGIHFIDNGNYHYMSAILLDQVKEPFTLVVLDHHPDMQAPAFGDILSCGGWVLDVIERNEFVRDIHVIGADAGLIDKLDAETRARAHFHDFSNDPQGRGLRFIFEELSKSEFPVYLSIDKDVLSRDGLVTNWDQGEMCIDDMLSFVRELQAKCQIIGIDVCGECALEQEGIAVDAEIKRNDEFNIKLLNEIK